MAGYLTYRNKMISAGKVPVSKKRWESSGRPSGPTKKAKKKKDKKKSGGPCFVGSSKK